MIREIYFEAGLYNYINDSGQSKNEIIGLNKVNIFVGANNSGKSRFIRKLLMDNYHSKIKGLSNIGNMEGCNKAITQVRDQLTQIINKYRAKGADVSSTIDIEAILKEMKTAGDAEQHKANINNLATLKQLIDNSDLDDSIRSEMNDFFKRQVKKLGDIPYATIIFKDYRAVYILIMRGLRPLVLDKLDNIKGKSTPYSNLNCFEERAIYDYFYDQALKANLINNMLLGEKYNLKEFFVGNYKFTIFTGLNLYDETKKMLLGTHEERRFIKEYEDFLKLNFFYDHSITLIPRASDDVLYIKIGDQEERPIYDLGDGLQTIIISTFPAFRYREEKLLLFVEEPELTLHPGMQRKLLDAYCDFDNIQVFITTHSNHFLDLTLDFNDMCSIFSFEKVSDKEFQIKNVTPNKEVLDLLGVRSSSVFLSNCVIWVEGITDRLYIRKFLELYNKKHGSELKYEEDKHYSI
ncbi:MAG: ATP-dependent nuclease, partial [Thermodesulfobacteriota bacterium]